MSEKPNKAKQVRERPAWLNIILGIIKYAWFPASCLIVLLVGLTVGYVVMGHQPAGEVFQIQTWKHLFDLVFAN
jgi:hypothetical protein